MVRSDQLPGCTANDIANLGLVDTELLCERYLADATAIVDSAYVDDLVSREFSVSIPFAGRVSEMTALPHLVSNIIGIASQEKMPRITAAPNVAMVETPHTFGNRPDFQEEW